MFQMDETKIEENLNQVNSTWRKITCMNKNIRISVDQRKDGVPSSTANLIIRKINNNPTYVLKKKKKKQSKDERRTNESIMQVKLK